MTPDDTTSGQTAFGIWLDRAIRTRHVPGGKGWLSQKILAEAVGVKPPHINRIILGKGRPSIELVLKIASYLGEDPNSLLQLADFEPINDAIALSPHGDPLAAQLLSIVRELMRDRRKLPIAIAAWTAVLKATEGNNGAGTDRSDHGAAEARSKA